MRPPRRPGRRRRQGGAIKPRFIRAAIALRAALGLGAGLLAPLGVQAHGAHDQHKADERRPSTVQVSVPDVALVDASGRERKLKSEVMGERVVVVNFVFTTCTTVCPISSAILAQVQQRLGVQVGKDVQLVSISVDPQRDTPARLKAYASKVGAGAGWTWLTGRKEVVDGVLKAFGAYATRPEDHPAMMLIGSARTGRWTRMYGFPSATEVLAQVTQHVAECSSGPANTAGSM